MLCTSAEHRLNRSDPKRKGEVQSIREHPGHDI